MPVKLKEMGDGGGFYNEAGPRKFQILHFYLDLQVP